jgi:hypothetical protein
LWSHGQYYELRMAFRGSGIFVGNTVDGTGKFANFTDGGINLQGGLGPVAEYFINERYAFSTGLWYTVKPVGIVVTRQFLTENFANNPAISKSLASESFFNLQYLQVPLTMKLHTSDIFQQSRMYVQFGGTLDVKISEKALDRTSNALYQFQQTLPEKPGIFQFGDISLYMGAGVEHRVRGAESICVGLFYQRGLTEIQSRTFEDLYVKNGYVGLEVMYKF